MAPSTSKRRKVRHMPVQFPWAKLPSDIKMKIMDEIISWYHNSLRRRDRNTALALLSTCKEANTLFRGQFYRAITMYFGEPVNLFFTDFLRHSTSDLIVNLRRLECRVNSTKVAVPEPAQNETRLLVEGITQYRELRFLDSFTMIYLDPLHRRYFGEPWVPVMTSKQENLARFTEYDHENQRCFSMMRDQLLEGTFRDFRATGMVDLRSCFVGGQPLIEVMLLRMTFEKVAAHT